MDLQVVEAPKSSQLSRLVDDWLAEARASGRSLRTIEAYSWPVRNVLLPYCAREGISHPSELDRHALNRLSQQLLDGADGKTRSPASIASYLRQINVFLRWSAKFEGGSGETAKIAKPPKRVRDVLERQEIQRLEDAAQNERDALIVRTLADTGIRLGELLGLRVADLIQSPQGWYVKVLGKGNKERLVPIRLPLARRLRTYVEKRRPKDAATDRLFVTLRRGDTGGYGPVSKRSVETLMKDLADRAGLDSKRVHPHAFRHSFITFLLKGNVNPLKVAELVGHTSLDVIMEAYSHVRAEDSRSDLERLLVD